MRTATNVSVQKLPMLLIDKSCWIGKGGDWETKTKVSDWIERVGWLLVLKTKHKIWNLMGEKRLERGLPPEPSYLRSSKRKPISPRLVLREHLRSLAKKAETFNEFVSTHDSSSKFGFDPHLRLGSDPSLTRKAYPFTLKLPQKTWGGTDMLLWLQMGNG